MPSCVIPSCRRWIKIAFKAHWASLHPDILNRYYLFLAVANMHRPNLLLEVIPGRIFYKFRVYWQILSCSETSSSSNDGFWSFKLVKCPVGNAQARQELWICVSSLTDPAASNVDYVACRRYRQRYAGRLKKSTLKPLFPSFHARLMVLILASARVEKKRPNQCFFFCKYPFSKSLYFQWISLSAT